MSLSRLQQRIRKTLENHQFTIIKDHFTDEKFRLISNFGEDLEQSTFYIDKKINSNSIVIGAHIILDNKILTRSLSNKIQIICTDYNVSCSPIIYNTDNDTGTISLQTMYNFLKYNEKNFLLYINNFKICIKTLQLETQKYLFLYKDFIYLDLSMFSNINWALFDLYTYIFNRDKQYDGSWVKYINALHAFKANHSQETHFIQMCQKFEEINGIPIDVVCDYVVDQIMEYYCNEKGSKVLN